MACFNDPKYRYTWSVYYEGPSTDAGVSAWIKSKMDAGFKEVTSLPSDLAPFKCLLDQYGKDNPGTAFESEVYCLGNDYISITAIEPIEKEPILLVLTSTVNLDYKYTQAGISLKTVGIGALIIGGVWLGSKLLKKKH